MGNHVFVAFESRFLCASASSLYVQPIVAGRNSFRILKIVVAMSAQNPHKEYIIQKYDSVSCEYIGSIAIKNGARVQRQGPSFSKKEYGALLSGIKSLIRINRNGRKKPAHT